MNLGYAPSDALGAANHAANRLGDALVVETLIPEA